MRSIGIKVISKAKNVSIKQLERKFCSSEEESGMLQKLIEELIRRYREQKTMSGSRVGKLVETAAMHLAAMAMCIITPSPKRFYE